MGLKVSVARDALTKVKFDSVATDTKINKSV